MFGVPNSAFDSPLLGRHVIFVAYKQHNSYYIQPHQKFLADFQAALFLTAGTFSELCVHLKIRLCKKLIKVLKKKSFGFIE